MPPLEQTGGVAVRAMGVDWRMDMARRMEWAERLDQLTLTLSAREQAWTEEREALRVRVDGLEEALAGQMSMYELAVANVEAERTAWQAERNLLHARIDSLQRLMAPDPAAFSPSALDTTRTRCLAGY